MATPAATVTVLNDRRRTPPQTRPRVGPRALERTRLVKRLAASSDAVIALSAPAGYGKSTLIVQWCAVDPRPFAWVRGCEYVDSAQLLEHTAAAVERLPGVQAPVPTTIAGLCRALAARSQPFVLVLDEAERMLRAGGAAIVGAIADHLPPGSQLVVAGRGLPVMPLARLRVEDRVHELGSDALAFTGVETSQLLRGFGLSRRRAAELAVLTEGWPAAVVLAGRCDGDRRLLGRMLSDYLSNALLEGLDDDDRRLLQVAAITEPVSGDLAANLTDRADAAGTLERLWRDNLFLTRGSDRSYRLHPLVRGFLAEQIEMDDAGAARRLRRKAADWCQANGRPVQAVELAIATGDLGQAAALAGVHASALAHRGGAETVERWLDALVDVPELTAGGRLPLVATWLSAVGGRAADAERWACVAELGTGRDPTVAMLVRSAISRGGADQMRADAAAASRRLDPADELVAIAALLEGWAQLLGERLDQADDSLGLAAAAAGARRFDDLAALALSGRALRAIQQGDWTAARDRAREAMRLLDGAAGRSGPAALGFAVAGRVAAHRGDGVAADQLLDRALGLVDWLTGAMPWLAVRARLEAARLAVVLGRSEVALALCQAAQDMPGRWLSGPGTGDDLPLQALFARGAADAWAATLSPAELRVLPLLATHLSFREIGERLFVSRNTVKTQAISIYRKLGVNSRNQAVTRAGALGLIVA